MIFFLIILIKIVIITKCYPNLQNTKIISIQNGKILNLTMSQHFIITTLQTSIMQFYDISTYQKKYNINITNFITNPLMLLDFSIINNKDLFLLLDNNRIIKINLETNVSQLFLDESYNYPIFKFKRMQFTTRQFLLLQQNDKNIYQYQVLSKTLMNQIFNSYQHPNTNIKTCIINQTHFNLVNWHSNCYIAFSSCSFFQCLMHGQYQNSGRCVLTDYNIINYKNIQFSKDCQSVIYDWKQSDPKIFKFGQNYQTILFYQLNSAKQLFFADINSTLLGKISQTNQFVVYQINRIQYNQPIYTIQLDSSVCFYQYNVSKNKLVTGNHTQIWIYEQNIASTNTGNQTNTNTTTTGNQTTTNNQTTPNPNQNITTQPPNNQIQQQQQQKPSQLKDFIGQVFKNSISTILTSTFYVFQILPISFYFMRFINFWGICTLYIFLPINTSISLKKILLNVYKAVNSSIFAFLNINVQLTFNIRQKFQQQFQQQYGISSDFFNGNLQNFSLLFFSLTIVAVLKYSTQYMSDKNIIKQTILQLKFPLMMITQFASIMSGFYFNLITISNNGNHQNFQQKINLILHIFFIVLSTLIPFFSMIIAKKQQKHERQFIKKLGYFYDCMCNCLIPLTLVIGNLPLFMILNFFFYLLSTYLALKQRQFRLNKVILSIQLVLFHIGYGLMAIIDKKQYPITFQIIDMIIHVVLFLGAVHEGCSLLFGLLYDLFISVKSRFFSTKIISQNNNNKQINFKKNFMLKRTNQKKLTVQKCKKKNSVQLQCIETNYNNQRNKKKINILTVKFDRQVEFFEQQIKVNSKNSLVSYISLRKKIKKIQSDKNTNIQKNKENNFELKINEVKKSQMQSLVSLRRID